VRSQPWRQPNAANRETHVSADLLGSTVQTDGSDERANVVPDEQITRAKNHVNKTMTMEQLLEAEQRAAEWMRKTKKIPPSSIEDSPVRQPKLETDASTA
jgi:hypothetical protein